MLLEYTKLKELWNNLGNSVVEIKGAWMNWQSFVQIVENKI